MIVLMAGHMSNYIFDVLVYFPRHDFREHVSLPVHVCIDCELRSDSVSLLGATLQTPAWCCRNSCQSSSYMERRRGWCLKTISNCVIVIALTDTHLKHQTGPGEKYSSLCRSSALCRILLVVRSRHDFSKTK